MQTPATPGDALRPSPVLDDETRSDAFDVLNDVLEWTLPADRWAEVEKRVDALATALEGGGVDAVRLATGELERLSPYRAVPIADAILLAVPQQVRERVGPLIHSLEAPVPRREDVDARGATPDEGDGT